MIEFWKFEINGVLGETVAGTREQINGIFELTHATSAVRIYGVPRSYSYYPMGQVWSGI